MKLNINLLPPEVAKKELYQNRLSLINQLSIFGLILMILVTGSILVLRLLQTQELQAVTTTLSESTQRVETLKTEEGLLLNLKKRIGQIINYSNQPSKQIDSLDLMTVLKPANIKTAYLSIDRLGNITYSGEASSSAEMGVFFGNLTNPDQTESRLTKINSDSVSRTTTGKYKFDLTITAK